MTTLVGGGTLPVGTILPFGGNVVPDGFFLCDGSLLNRNDFAELFLVISTNWGTTDGLNFRIPTTQGLLLRGRANGSGFDPDRNSRTAIQTGSNTGDNVGSYQSNRFGSHNHGGGNHRHSTSNAYISAGPKNSTGGFDSRIYQGTQYSNYSGTIISTQGGNQTIGNNVSVNFIIKY